MKKFLAFALAFLSLAAVSCAPDLMQRLSRLPTAPHVSLLRRSKPYPFLWDHKHHL
jgi:hypothetical protein